MVQQIAWDACFATNVIGAQTVLYADVAIYAKIVYSVGVAAEYEMQKINDICGTGKRTRAITKRRCSYNKYECFLFLLQIVFTLKNSYKYKS